MVPLQKQALQGIAICKGKPKITKLEISLGGPRLWNKTLVDNRKAIATCFIFKRFEKKKLINN